MLKRIWGYHTSTPARAAISLLSLAALLYSYAFTYQYFTPVAMHDLIMWVPDFRKWVEHRFTFHDLIKPHNDHRIATTRLLLLLDSIAFAMNGRLPVLVNLALLASIGIMLWRCVRMNGVAGTVSDWPPLFWVALVSATCQADNLILPFQVQFAITCAAACAAALLLVGAEGRGRKAAAWRAAVAGLLAVTAMFSMGSGVLLTLALCTILPMMRARAEVWLAFLPICTLGAWAAESGLSTVVAQSDTIVPLLAWRFLPLRGEYASNFLASAFNLFDGVATGIGALMALALVCVATPLLSRRVGLAGLSKQAIPAGDAALLALALGVSACGAAASLTPRITFGPAAALVPRYATMSLLLIAALVGLYLRRNARRQYNPPMYLAPAPVAAGLLLSVLNLPGFTSYAASTTSMMLQDAQLLGNNVANPGPGLIILGDTNFVGPSIAFLRAKHLNMFSAAQSLAPDLVKALHHADLERLPYCRGAIEASYRVDHTGFMVSGWAKDSTGVQTAQWIAALLPDGTLIDTARALVPRYDLDGGDAADRTSVGFEAGFRLPATDRDDGSSPPQQKVAILGIFPGMPEQLCRMPALAPLGDIEIAPLPKLHGVSAVASVTMEQAIGFRIGESSDLIRAWPWPGGLRTWRLENGVSGATLRFTIPAGDVASMAIPFTMATPRQGQVSVSFLMQDGTSIASALPGMWSWVAWHAAVLDADISVRHGGVTAIEVTATGKPGLLVGGPIHAELSPEWSRVY